MTGAAATTEALFNLVRQQMEGEDFIVVEHGTDPRVVKKEMADQGREPEQQRFFSIAETIELNSDGDEEDLPVRELLTRNGKSSFEKVRRCPIVAIQFCWCPYSELWLAHWQVRLSLAASSGFRRSGSASRSASPFRSPSPSPSPSQDEAEASTPWPISNTDLQATVAALVGAAISNVKASIAAANALPPKATDAAPAVAAETPETREMITSHFPLEGQHVVVDQLDDGVLREGLCFRVSKEGAGQQTFVAAFGDGFWLGFPQGTPWATCPESRQVNIAGVYLNSRQPLVEGFILRSMLIEGWTVFKQFVHPWHVWPEENGPKENATEAEAGTPRRRSSGTAVGALRRAAVPTVPAPRGKWSRRGKMRQLAKQTIVPGGRKRSTGTNAKSMRKSAAG